MVICFFCFNLQAQKTETTASEVQESEQLLLSPCGAAANFSINAFVTPPSCCAQFTAPNDGQYGSVSWDFGDGNSSSDPTSVFHCYSQNGTYISKHTVVLDDGTVCIKTKNVTITNCLPCPELVGISVSLTDPDPLTHTCSPTNLQGGGSPESVNCFYRFAPILNGSSTGSTFSWELYLLSFNPFSYSLECSVQSSPAFKILKSSPAIAQGLWFAIRVTMTRPGCTTQITSKFFTVSDYQCNFIAFLKSPTNNPSDTALLKKAIANTQVTKNEIYPNPADNSLNVSNLKDLEEYTFDIQNTLGQTVLTQKISSIDASIDVSGLLTGLYISVLKSKGKIISTAKVYKK